MTYEQVVSAKLVDGRLEVVRRYPSNSMYACYPARPVPDRVVKDIYGAVDGKIQLVEIIEGTHTPASMEPEKIEFPNA